MRASTFLPVLSSFSIAFAQSPRNCPLLGPIYPSPPNLSSSAAFQSAIGDFSSVLSTALASGSFDNETTLFSVSVFSASDNSTLFTHHYIAPGLKGYLPSQVLNNDTIYRIGSVSKLFTVYTLLAKAGYNVLEDPITKYVPELGDQDEEEVDDVDGVRWSEVSVGALASHMAGISRSYSLYDVATLNVTGLPPLDPSLVPTCGITPGNKGVAPCNRAELLAGLKSQKPLTSTFNTPLYSNSAFVLLGFVIERLTDQTFDQAIQSILSEPLGLSRTFTVTPNDTNIVEMPEYDQQFGDDAAAGGIYSSLSDLSTLGLSILDNKLLSPRLTRSWMKPLAHTADPYTSIGAPWEIVRTEVPIAQGSNITRIVDLYTKAGDIDGYSSNLILDPDHGIGFAVMTAGRNAPTMRDALASLLAESFVAAAEDAGREHIADNYAGSFAGAVEGYNTNLTLAVDERPGLALTLSANGTDLRTLMASLMGDRYANASVRLYPSGLKSRDEKRVRMTAIIDTAREASAGALLSDCQSWISVDSVQYGGEGIDGYEVSLGEDGKVENVTSLAFRMPLMRTS